MKTRFLFILILLSLFAKGQSSAYRPFPTDNGNWIYQYYDDFHNPTGIYTNYSLNGDTVLSSINYKKIYTNSSYSGAIRESGKVVYFIPDTSLTEVVLYNFNLTVGDTVFNPYGGAMCSHDTAIVTSTDSINTSDGYHRTIFFNSFVTWIEGIGSMHYLLQPYSLACLSGNDLIGCMQNDSSFVYPNGSTNCTVGIMEHRKPTISFSAYPNPFSASTEIHFTLKEASTATIEITDITGRVIKTVNAQFTSGEQTFVWDGTEANGMYFVKIKTPSGTISGKVLKGN